ncbi:MAG: response regulator [Candidatus Binataceae bacterium]|nr:response regulator [Candidatus Binataceae bacterium]
MVVAVSADEALFMSLSNAIPGQLPVMQCQHAGVAFEALATGTARLVVIDDDILATGFCHALIGGARQFAPDAKIIYVTSHHTKWREAEARNAGVHFYAVKPVDGELLSRVARALMETTPHRAAA